MADPGRESRAAELQKAFNQAVSMHVAGRLAEAASLYESLLRRIPNHPDVLDFYGTLRHQVGENDLALALVGRSIALRPLAAATRNRLGAIHKALGNRSVAAREFRRSALADPRLGEPAANLATWLAENGETGPALSWCERALAAQPGSFEALIRRAALRNALGQHETALADVDEARQLQPLAPEVWLQSALARAGRGRFEEAVRATRHGIVSNPAAHELYAVMSSSRGPLKEDVAVVAWARRALCLKPKDARLWACLGAESYRAAEPEAAMRAATRAALLDPGLELSLQTLGAAGFQCDRLALARAACRWGLAAHPHNADMAYQLAEVEFITGDLRQAWALHEARIRRPAFRPRLAEPAAWRGPGTETGPLLVASEQGVGDEVIFLSCLPDLLARVRVPVVVEVDYRIVDVMARTFPGVTVVPRQLVPGDALGQFFDYGEIVRRHGVRHVVFAGSLPRFFRTDREHPTPTGGYLKPAPERIEHWRSVLAAFRPQRTVGVVWRSALMTRYRARHHAAILEWAPIFRTTGCAFINLMHGDVRPELDQLRLAEGVEIHQLHGIDLWNDIDDLLALLAALDLVVAARTANCAFSAAVGTPTIRVAQSFNRISDGRDFFFSNVWPTLPRDRKFDARRAAEGAARLLREKAGAP